MHERPPANQTQTDSALGAQQRQGVATSSALHNGKPFANHERKAARPVMPVQRRSDDSPGGKSSKPPDAADGTRPPSASEPRAKGDRGGLPTPLRHGIERLSGLDMGGVRVHRDSPKPAKLQALAYTQGRNIYVAPGQERHLPHEAWHVVQQAQGRVSPTLHIKSGASINDSGGLEREADAMGALALATPIPRAGVAPATSPAAYGQTIQRKVGFEFEMIDILTQRRTGGAWVDHSKGAVLGRRPGFVLTADEGEGQSQLEIIIKPIDETNAGQVATLVGVTAPAVVTIIDDIAQQSFDVWTIANQIPGSGGGARDRYRSVTNGAAAISGQLQMTGGLRMAKLYDHVSGAQATNYLAALAPPGVNADDDIAQNTLNVYTNGPLAVTALGVVNATVPGGLPLAVRQQIAAIGAMMATILFNMRTPPPLPYAKAAAGPHLARTDFSRFMMRLPAAAKTALTPTIMRTVVLNTLNAHLPAPAALADPVVPPGVHPPVAALGYGAELTIGAWVGGVVPTAGLLFGHKQGRDRLTRKRYPGTAAQRAGLESMGSYGNKLDPGNKPIVEFRTLAFVFVNDLPGQLQRLVDFLNHP